MSTGDFPQWFYRLGGKATEGEGKGRALLDGVEDSDTGLFMSYQKDDGKYKYTRFDNYCEFFKYNETLEEWNMRFHEIARPHVEQKPRFDIDLKRSHLPEGADIMDYGDHIVSQLLEAIIAVLDKDSTPLDLTRDVALFQSHGEDKYSVHLIICGFKHQNNTEARAFYELVINELDDPEVARFIDSAIYGNNRTLRVLGSGKLGDVRYKAHQDTIIYKGKSYTFKVEDAGGSHGPDYEKLAIMGASLITHASHLKPLPAYAPEGDTQCLGLKIPEGVYQDMISAYNDYSSEMIDSSAYEVRDWSGGMVFLSRVASGYCGICARTHEGDGALLWCSITRETAKVWFKCRRSEKGTSIVIAELEGVQHDIRDANPDIAEFAGKKKYILPHPKDALNVKGEFYYTDLVKKFSPGYVEYPNKEKAIEAIKAFAHLCVWKTAGKVKFFVKQSPSEPFSILSRNQFIKDNVDVFHYWDDVKDKETKKEEATICHGSISKLLEGPDFLVSDVVCRAYHADKPYVKRGILNMFPGFKAKLVDKVDMDIVQPLLDHILNIWCRGNAEHFEYVMQLIAHPIQNPDKPKTEIGLAVVGEQGAGKSWVATFFATYVYGMRITNVDSSGIANLTRNFNIQLAGKMLQVVHELSGVMDGGKTNFDTLKSMITDPVMRIEAKGKDAISTDNLLNIWAFSNHKFSIKMEKGDRRFCILECANDQVGNAEYHTRLNKILSNQSAGNHVYTYLRRRPVTLDINWMRQSQNIPATEIRLQTIANSADPIEQWMDILAGEGEGELYPITGIRKGDEYLIRVEDAHRAFTPWLKTNFPNHASLNINKFRCAFLQRFGYSGKTKVAKIDGKTYRGVYLLTSG